MHEVYPISGYLDLSQANASLIENNEEVEFKGKIPSLKKGVIDICSIPRNHLS